ncbi:MAG TPA: 2-oxoglutarate and iron-dependent oxygenase domain-containing protein [Streptosporangiaceae bacterium]|nr:2-oxoglutarate and iron-dependent oxygenase domain-containing protein [Streptosporangiaceae bacterium]
MTPAIPVIDVAAAEAGDRAQLAAVRMATEEFGAVQVVNHGVPRDLVTDLNARMARLLGRPRAEKAKLASPHPTAAGGSGRMTSGGWSKQIAAWRDGRPYVAELA